MLASYGTKLSEESVVCGIKDTVQALNEAWVERLIFCADLASVTGGQCRECLALHVRLEAPVEPCVYCGSTAISLVDLKAAMIAHAYRLGCAIEVVSRSSELERVGGIGAVVEGGTSAKETKKRGVRPDVDRERDSHGPGAGTAATARQRHVRHAV